MLSNNGGNDSWDTAESSTQHFNTQVVVLMLLLVTSTSYAGCVCVGVCAHEYLPGFYRGIGGHTHLGCFSLTVINHQRVTWFLLFFFLLFSKTKIHHFHRKIFFQHNYCCKSHMKAQRNMASALLPVVPNTHTGCSTAYYASVWVDTQRWHKPATLPEAEPVLVGGLNGVRNWKTSSDLLM